MLLYWVPLHYTPGRVYAIEEMSGLLHSKEMDPSTSQVNWISCPGHIKLPSSGVGISNTLAVKRIEIIKGEVWKRNSGGKNEFHNTKPTSKVTNIICS